MAAGTYVGVAGIARKVTAQYVGVAGVARRVIGGYAGVAGVARKTWEATPMPESVKVLYALKYGTFNVSGSSITLKKVGTVYKRTGLNINDAKHTVTSFYFEDQGKPEFQSYKYICIKRELSGMVYTYVKNGERYTPINEDNTYTIPDRVSTSTKLSIQLGTSIMAGTSPGGGTVI